MGLDWFELNGQHQHIQLLNRSYILSASWLQISEGMKNLHINKWSKWLDFQWWPHDDQHIALLEVFLQAVLEPVGEALSEEDNVWLNHTWTVCADGNLFRKYVFWNVKYNF